MSNIQKCMNRVGSFSSFSVLLDPEGESIGLYTNSQMPSHVTSPGGRFTCRHMKGLVNNIPSKHTWWWCRHTRSCNLTNQSVHVHNICSLFLRDTRVLASWAFCIKRKEKNFFFFNSFNTTFSFLLHGSFGLQLSVLYACSNYVVF